MLRRFALAVAFACTFVVLDAAVAAAHVTVSPPAIPQGTDDVILTFRVPNESATAVVDGLRIHFPLDHPIVLLNPEAGSGWQVAVHKTALPKPVTTDDGTFTSTVSEIDWTGGSIPVGQFGEFNILAQGIPTGTPALVFKAIQSYSDGTVVSWIQVPTRAVPDPPHPAPTITLTAPGGGAPSATTTTAGPAQSATQTAVATGGTNWQSIAALILAALALVLAVLAVWLGRPRLGSGATGDE
jgi:periplasmic copper chaperone A